MSNLDDVLIPNDQGRILKFRYVRTTFGCLIARRYQSNSSISIRYKETSESKSNLLDIFKSMNFPQNKYYQSLILSFDVFTPVIVKHWQVCPDISHLSHQTSKQIRGQYWGNVICLDQSEDSAQVTWPVSTNQRPVFTHHLSIKLSRFSHLDLNFISGWNEWKKKILFYILYVFHLSTSVLCVSMLFFVWTAIPKNYKIIIYHWINIFKFIHYLDTFNKH